MRHSRNGPAWNSPSVCSIHILNGLPNNAWHWIETKLTNLWGNRLHINTVWFIWSCLYKKAIAWLTTGNLLTDGTLCKTGLGKRTHETFCLCMCKKKTKNKRVVLQPHRPTLVPELILSLGYFLFSVFIFCVCVGFLTLHKNLPVCGMVLLNCSSV